MVIGAYCDDNEKGSAYVFEKPGGGWATTSTYNAKLTASDGEADDYFGVSVAIDGGTVIVGAYCDDSDKGSAYVFEKPGGGWATTSTYNAKLTASDGSADDCLGISVAIDGDTVVVGAYYDDSDKGSAYVFEKPGGGWADTTQTAKLTSSDGVDGDQFGVSVDIDGDTVVVGAHMDDDRGSASGSAYVFEKPGGGWADTTQTAKLTTSDGAATDQFGCSVVINGDTVVVGAVGDDSAKGSAYVFVEPVSGWATTSTPKAKLTASDRADWDLFGYSVDIDVDTVVIGAHYEDNYKGSVYVFEKPGGGWLGLLTETIKLSASDGATFDYLGASVAFKGETAVIGAYGDDSNKGSAYIFLLDTDPPNAPVVTSDTPNKDTTPTWTWSSGGGGGSGWFRYKLDSGGWSSETTDTSFTPSSVLSQGEGVDHTLYVQERDAAENWSGSGSFTIEIDSAKPCSEASSPSATDELNTTFDITYTRDDVYDDGSICGEASSGSGVAQVDLYVMGPGESSYTLTDTDNEGSIDGIFQYTVTTEGIYHFKTIATDRAGNEEYKESESYDTKTIYASEFAGYAILAVGEIAGDPDGLLSHTLTANNVYQHLVNRKFTLVDDPEDPLDFIKYFNPYSEVQTGEDDYSEGGTISYWTAMQNAIQQWALDKMTVLPGPLYIILENHGSTDRFYLKPPAYLEAYELEGWLDNLEAGLAAEGIDENIVIILGTCYSASFINELSEEGKNRIIVASTAADEPSYRGPKEPGGVRDGEFFITALFNQLGVGWDLKTGFERAVQSTETHTDSGLFNSSAPYFDTAMQHPHLDDNADGQGSNTLTPGGDGDVAQNVYLGWGTAAPEPVVVTEVGKVPGTPITGHIATLWAKVSDKDRTSSVWVEIREPGMTLEGGEEQQIVDLIEVQLATWNATESRYEGNYNDFWTEGRYTLFFYAKDNTGIISPFRKTYLYKSTSTNDPPGAFNLLAPANGSTTTTTAGLGAGWEVSVDPDGVTYTLEIRHDPADTEWGTDTFYYKKEGITRNMCVVQWQAGFIDERSYLWKVTAIDEYGAYTVSNQEWGFNINDDNPGNGWLDIMVYDNITDAPIEHAEVVGSSPLAVENFGSGYFLGFAPAGSYSVTVSATGYETDVFGVGVVENRTIPKEFGLNPLGEGPATALPAILLLLLGE